MNQTREEYITEQHKEFEAEGMKPIDYMYFNLDQEYYDLIKEHIKQGGTITQEIFNSLTAGQQFHFNKHYNYRSDKVINSEYQQAITEGEKQIEINVNNFLSLQTKKQQEQEIKKQKEKQITINQLSQEIEQLQNSLFDYNSLSPIGKRNIVKYDHERKQVKIKERITELQKQIKILA